ncbi:DUF4430 domain-containing protein [Latilactobacillus curvatus]|uniref:DUF4430 domain-containing protein n=1 Tax=Latilactobacillus curvatus TaxID=28038 RepID=A0A385ABN4_LATCU|nr:DUF4430 domain-containing protein [Latilactobacillus curvatus]AXN34978.1 DUF4430 domain-containing protein [Latilactobacillus curvatus]MCT3524792.1 DUF4430 domain-containing protein [Latilactobacillus curvatus]MCT3532689.1 DUF4430 domain-containing protein [Latilactobacillus curvatus]MCW8780023.1 DUF4430 domain-containing protein [Latilactobacillus curvatus]MDG2977350.1 DUF4430 domain-containing protein [Latilactobacillus curvatus]
MSKKRIITIVTSLLIICGIGYGTYASVSQGSETSQVAKTSSSHATKGNAKSEVVGLDGKVKPKKSKKHSAETKVESKEAQNSSKAASTKKVEAKKAESQKVEATKAEAQKAQVESQAASGSAPADSQGQKSQATQAGQTANVNKPADPAPAPQPVAKTVTLSVYGPISEGNHKWRNDDSVEIKDGDMVIDVLKRDLASKGMALSYKGTGATVYVRGINGIFEFDRGGQSGWLYRVNGVFPDHSCGNYPVKNGDVIDWMYTEDLGHDRNAPQG